MFNSLDFFMFCYKKVTNNFTLIFSQKGYSVISMPFLNTPCYAFRNEKASLSVLNLYAYLDIVLLVFSFTPFIHLFISVPGLHCVNHCSFVYFA